MPTLCPTTSPGKKAQRTAKWARTMTKWLITYSHRRGARWNLVDFGGRYKAESRGIVDIVAIRKNHRRDAQGLKRGDLFEIILIQTKGGSAPLPTDEDMARLYRVGRYHKATAVILAEWKQGERLSLYRLCRRKWTPATPDEIFG